MLALAFLIFGAFIAFRAMEFYRGLDNKEQVAEKAQDNVIGFFDNLFPKK